MPYEERYVAFIDVLGFSNTIIQSASDLSRYEELATLLTKLGKRNEQIDALFGDDFKYQTFSDSIVMSDTVGPNALHHMLDNIAALSVNMLSAGLLLRGGISKGKLHHKNNIMFGPAFLDAYRNESTVATHPRVVLSREVHSDFTNYVSQNALASKWVRRSNDGPPFVHYLSTFEKLNEEPATDGLRKSNAAKFALGCQRVIQNLLQDAIYEPRHYEKLKWLAVYWNTTVGYSSNRLLTQIEFPNWESTHYA